MIALTLLADLDDVERLTAWGRRIEVEAPPGYEVKARCAGWGRTLETGAVHIDIVLKISSPPDMLPRIVIGGAQ